MAMIGSGHVGQALASGLLRHGHEVVLGSRDPEQEKVRAWLQSAGDKGCASGHAEAVRWAEWVFVCVPGAAAEETIRGIGSEALAGKLVVDVTNVVKRIEGGMSLLWGLEDSNAQRIQRVAPEARVVKAFNTVGSRQMIDPRVVDGPPSMPLAGDDIDAKEAVSELLQDVGWEPADLGALTYAPLLEAMALVWMRYGSTHNSSEHAFRILRPPS